jgi:hypothetical protein
MSNVSPVGIVLEVNALPFEPLTQTQPIQPALPLLEALTNKWPTWERPDSIYP